MKNFIMTLAALAISAMSFVSTATAGETRSIWVVSDEAQPLTLKAGSRIIMSFNPNWQQAGMGKMAQIQIPLSVITSNRTLVLEREDGAGYSTWRSQHMSFLRNSNVPKNDPACVGGRAWCATRGL